MKLNSEFRGTGCMIGGMCVSVCVWVCFAWEVGECFVLRFLHYLFLTYLYFSQRSKMLTSPGIMFFHVCFFRALVPCNWHENKQNAFSMFCDTIPAWAFSYLFVIFLLDMYIFKKIFYKRIKSFLKKYYVPVI